MKIIDVVCSAGKTGFFFDDQRAIKKGAVADGAFYRGATATEGFTQVRQAGESISVQIVLDDGQVAVGDCAAVQYSGAGGRDPLFLAANFIPFIQKEIAPKLIGHDVTSFRELAAIVDNMVDPATGKRIHTAIRYGVTQALLDAVAKSQKKLMADVVAAEYGTTVSKNPIPIFTQSGDNRYDNVDKMIIKSADVLPHGLINNVKTKLGEHGELLEEYVGWLAKRVKELAPYEGYKPTLHIDVYGTIGLAFGNDNYTGIADYLAKLEKAAQGLDLRIEGPVDVENLPGQVEALSKITETVDKKGIKVQIVADEWCNTFEDIKLFADNKAGHMVQIKTPDLGGVNNIAEAVLYCNKVGIGSYQGGTCNETDLSAKCCVHIAMAVHPTQILAKPGMGVDEGYMIVYNEMQRILALGARR